MKNAIVVFPRRGVGLCHHAGAQLAQTCFHRPVKQTIAPARRTDDAAAAAQPGEPRAPSFVKMKNSRPVSAASLAPREKLVLAAALALPGEGLTPASTMAALVRQGLDLSPSAISYVLQCLERKGLLRLARKR